MSAPPTLEDQTLQHMNQFRDVLICVNPKYGLSPLKVIDQWLKDQEERILNDYSGKLAFRKLHQDRCSPTIISGLFGGLRVAKQCDRVWTTVFRSVKAQRKAAAALRHSSKALNDIFEGLLSEPSYSLLMTSQSHVPDLFTFTAALTSYSELFDKATQLLPKIKPHKLSDLLKYLLTAYVKQTTKKAHDDEVSIIIGMALGGVGRSVGNQSMWRNGSYFKAIHRQLDGLAQAIHQFGVLIDEERKTFRQNN